MAKITQQNQAEPTTTPNSGDSYIYVDSTTKKLTTKNDAGTVVEYGAGGGTGDVVGPASAVDSNVAMFDGVSGKIIKDSGVTLSGTNTGDQTTVSGKSGSTDALNSATTTVDISGATAPTVGQTLTATSSTTATWQDAAGGLTPPVSSTDNGLVRWAGVGADAVQDTSNVLVDDKGRISQIGLGNSTFVGYLCGFNDNQASGKNSAYGFGSLQSNTTGLNNVAMGAQAMVASNGSRFSVGVGYGALSYQTGYGGTGIGYNSMVFNTSGTYNVGIGYLVGQHNQTGSENVLIGANAGFGVTLNSYSGNTFIGTNSGLTVATGSRNILIGKDIDLPTPTTNDHLNIGGMITADMTTDVVDLANISLTNLPTFADEAAAVTGGLATNRVYKTVTGELRIKL